MNKRRVDVSKPRRRAPAEPKRDGRVVRTRHALGKALTELMLDRPLDRITVQEVLDRARVGRSTFYAHFRDTRDLFLSDFERFLGVLEAWLDDPGAPKGRLVPVREFFSHVVEAKALIQALRASGELDIVWAIALGHFARMIEKRLEMPTHGAPLPRPLAARFLAGALMEMLKGWLDTAERPTARAMDESFHALAKRSFGTTLPRGQV